MQTGTSLPCLRIWLTEQCSVSKDDGKLFPDSDDWSILFDQCNFNWSLLKKENHTIQEATHYITYPNMGKKKKSQQWRGILMPLQVLHALFITLYTDINMLWILLHQHCRYIFHVVCNRQEVCSIYGSLGALLYLLSMEKQFSMCGILFMSIAYRCVWAGMIDGVWSTHTLTNETSDTNSVCQKYINDVLRAQLRNGKANACGTHLRERGHRVNR